VRRDGFSCLGAAKAAFTGDDAEELAGRLITHVEQKHGHSPPREHVLARIERHNGRD